MRIWSIHPKYLDTKGLLALWRETLLAKQVLMGKTKGYKNHPQLDRFKTSKNSINSINHYLSIVYQDAISRNYKFDKEKIDWDFEPAKISVSKGQINYEKEHLLKKLKTRDHNSYNKLINSEIELHPIFYLVEGGIEKWEVVQ